MSLNPYLYFVLLIELIIVSWIDLKTKKIKNYWSILNLCLVVIFNLSNVIDFNILIYSSILLGIGFLLFILKIMGAGDVKFLFSFFLILSHQNQKLLFSNLLVSTIILGSVLFSLNIIRNYQKIVASLKIGYINGMKDCFGTRFSFAPTILMAWIWLGIQIKINILK